MPGPRRDPRPAPAAPAPGPLDGSILDFLDAMRVEAGLSRNAIAAYRSDLGQMAAWMGERGITDWSDLDGDHVVEWLGERRDGGAAEASVARGLVALRMLVRFLVAEGQLRADPTARIPSPKLRRALPRTLTPEDVDALLRAFLIDGVVPGWRDLRDTALLETLYAAGARISEALGLRMGDIADDLSSVRLHGKGDKMRVVPFGAQAAQALRTWIDGDRPAIAARAKSPVDRVFLSKSGRPLDRQSAWRRVKEAAARVGLDPALSPHDLRHSFATHMLSGGADLRAVQEMLGHASIRTTEIYTHLDADHVRTVHRMFHPRG